MNPRILVVGDICIDEYHYGTAERMNPEAPVPVMKLSHIETRFGMSANVFKNLEALGARVEIVCPKEKSRKVRYVDLKSGYQLMRMDEDIKSLPFKADGDYGFFDAIVISDYNKGFIAEETILNLRRNFSGPIYIDTKKRLLPELDNTYYKVNEHEYADLLSEPDNIVVTLGAIGCKYQGVIYPTTPVNVVDVCGAGDVFLAAMAYKHTVTGDMAQALEFANKCATLSCKHVGCYTLKFEDILEASK